MHISPAEFKMKLLLFNLRYKGIVLPVIASFIALIFMAEFSSAEQLTVGQEVFVERGVIPKPNVIVPANDGGFIIAGEIAARHQAWALKIDAHSNVAWRYVANRMDVFPPADFGSRPDYAGAAVMTDGSVFLCGTMVRPPHMGIPGLITHLDKNGGVLFQKIMSPMG